MKKLLQTTAEAWLLLLTFLLPLKFGIFAAMPEASALFPEDWFSYLIINWSAVALGLLSGPALLLCLAAFPENGGRYRLVISSPFELHSLEHRLCEFAICRKCENLEAEFTREHWTLLAENNALESLCFHKNQL